jgi:hypothetical protein
MTDRQTDRHYDRQTDTMTDRQRDRETDRYYNRQTERRTDGRRSSNRTTTLHSPLSLSCHSPPSLHYPRPTSSALHLIIFVTPPGLPSPVITALSCLPSLTHHSPLSPYHHCPPQFLHTSSYSLLIFTPLINLLFSLYPTYPLPHFPSNPHSPSNPFTPGLAGYDPYFTTTAGFVSGIAFIVLTKTVLDQFGHLKIGNYTFLLSDYLLFFFCSRKHLI